jgi:hypothetical protein
MNTSTIKLFSMKQKSLTTLIVRLRICVAAFILAVLSFFLFSFAAHTYSEEFILPGMEKTKPTESFPATYRGDFLTPADSKMEKVRAGN